MHLPLFGKRIRGKEGQSLLRKLEEVKGAPSDSGSTQSDSGFEVPLEPTDDEEARGSSADPQRLSLTARWSTNRVKKAKRLWNLTPGQYSKLLELKQRISDIDHWKNDPFEAARFLLEKRGNVDRAETLFRRVHQWRIDNNIDTILHDYEISPLFNYFPIATLQGVDYDGDPIHLERPGVADCISLHHRLGPEEIYRMAVYMREMDTNPHHSPWHAQYEQEHGQPVKYFTIVIDLEGLNWNHMRPAMIAILGRVLLMSQSYYPFFAKRVILLRAPRIFKLIWSLAHHFVHDSVKKLIVFSTEQDYLEVIDRYMDRRVLPACICPEEGRGEGTLGFEKVKMEGGQLPPMDLTDAAIEELLEKDQTVLPSRQNEATTTTDRLHVSTQLITLGFLLEESKRVICL